VKQTKTGRAVLVMLAWQVAIATALVMWISAQHTTTWVGTRHSASGDQGFSISTQALLWLVVLVYGIPASLMSVAFGGVGVLLLNRRLGRRPVALGTLAALIGVLCVAAGTYALTLFSA
jgi:hypothetical protein